MLDLGTAPWQAKRLLRHPSPAQYFPAALAAFEDLDAPERAGAAGKNAQRSARRSSAPAAIITTGKATAIMAALRSPQLGQPPAITAAYAATVRSLIAVITTLNEQVKALQGQVEADFGLHPDAEIYLSQRPGLGSVLGAPRVLGVSSAQLSSWLAPRVTVRGKAGGGRDDAATNPHHLCVGVEEGRVLSAVSHIRGPAKTGSPTR